MKALTFKKSALAAALLVAAGSASAAASLQNLSYVAAAGAAPLAGTDSALVGVATELAKVGSGAVTANTDLKVLAVTIPAEGSIADGSTVNFTFANGGVSSDTYRLMTTDGTDISFVNTTLNGIRTNSAGDAVEYISFIVNETLAANSVFYLAPESANNSTDWAANDGLVFTVTESAANNAKLTATVTVDNPNVSDDSIYTAKKDIAVAKTGLKVNNFGSDIVTSVDFTEGALEFTVGKTVSESGFNITPVGYNTALTAAGTDVYPISDAELDNFTADLTLSMTNCDAVKVTNGAYSVSINNGGAVALTKDGGQDCTWLATDVDVHKDIAGGDDYTLTVAVTVDGETKITDNTVSLGYKVEHSNKTVYQSSQTVSVWSTDVIAVSGQELMFPLLTAANGSSSAFSLVKIDNSSESSATDILISGTVEQIEFVDGEKVSTFLPFENYKLNKSIAANSLGQITGDDVISSLVEAVGSDEFGYETTALEGLKKEALHHISVKFQVSAAETKDGSFGKVVAYNATNTGRIGVVSQ